MHLWTVVRVLQHMTEDKSNAKKAADAGKVDNELNLSSEDSLSAASLDEEESDDGGLSNEGDEDGEDMVATRATLEMPNFKMNTRDPVPEGYKRVQELQVHSNPRLTLVFLAYERPVADVTRH